MHTHNKAANILKLCVSSLDKIEGREQAVDKCSQNKDPKPFNPPDLIPSLSGGMFAGKWTVFNFLPPKMNTSVLSAGSKLLSNQGNHSFYHLNESTIMEEFLKDGGHILHAVFLAFKGSRFN